MVLLERIERHLAGKGQRQAEEAMWHHEYGALMRAHRIGSEITLRQLGRNTGLAPSVISELENGRRRWTAALAKTYLDGVAVKSIFKTI